MLKEFLLFILFFCAASPVFCFYDTNIETLEKSRYNRIYADESLSERLSRLENDMFGMTQSGDIDTRLAKLSQAAGTNLNPDNIIYPQNEYNYNVQPKRNVIQKFFDNVSDTFGSAGIVTGYTPGLYMPNYGYGANMYGNEFRNMLYNTPRHYCPYNNYHRYSPPAYFPEINNRIMPNQHFSAVPGSFNFNNNLNNRYYFPKYGRYGNYTGTYYPENVVTRTSVHILP